MSSGVVLELPALVALQTGNSSAVGAAASLPKPSMQIISDILNAASTGDLYKLTSFGAQYDLNAGDYDKRSAVKDSKVQNRCTPDYRECMLACCKRVPHM